MLVLSLGSLIPFFHSMFSIIKIIPCPRMAALVSNSALLGAFVALFLVSLLLYGNLWVTYIYLMSIWPWLAIGTIVARLHIGGDRGVSHFSPLVHLPVLAILGSGSIIGMLLALKNLSVIDCVVLSFLDPIWSAIFHSFLIRRIPYFENYSKIFALLIVVVFLYIYGHAYTGGVVKAYLDSVTFLSLTGTTPVGSYLLFLGSRAAGLLRCSYVKRSFIPKEVNALQQFKSLFPNFPSPIRFRLDAIFESGLMEDVPHAVGPTGTKDMYTLTDNLYMLPLSSIASWVIENANQDSLTSGLGYGVSIPGSPPYGLIYFLLAIFILSVALTPTATAKVLFDRGSSPHAWTVIPLLGQMLYIAIDLLYLNPYISRFQIVCVVALVGLILNLRTDLWLAFKGKYYRASMKELEFLQPSCLRDAQKHTLNDSLDKSSVEDFGTLLLETSIHHGNNIREYLKSAEKGKIWDPNPGARAAWKLAGSLVIRAIRNRKRIQGVVKKTKRDDKEFVNSVVHAMVSSASMDPAAASGHSGNSGKNLPPTGGSAKPGFKRAGN